MNISHNGLNLIKTFEGYRTHKYRDIVGKWTIGYGHLIREGEDFDEGITEEAATALLDRDVSIAEDCVNDNVEVVLTQGQFDSLVSLVYNWGTGHFEKSEGLQALNKGNYKKALAEFGEVVHAGSAISHGLENRRMAEAKVWNGEVVA